MYKSIEPEEGDFIPFHIWKIVLKSGIDYGTREII